MSRLSAPGTRRTATAALLLACSFAGAAAAAPVTVDDFSVVQELSAPPAASSAVAGDGILGGERHLAVSTEGMDPSDPMFSVEVLGGVLQFSIYRPGTRGRLVATWDGDGSGVSDLDPSGLGGVDLVDGTNDALVVEIEKLGGATIEAQIDVYTDAKNASRFSVTVTSDGGARFPFRYFGAIAGKGADFSSVGAIQVTLVSDAPQFNVVAVAAVGSTPGAGSAAGGD